MAKRLAITISGAVSLGSYEAGVLYEVLTALSAHNQNPATQPHERIEVDVLTGASAGAMTAAIVAQLLAGREHAWSTYDNPLYQAWVKDVDLRGLVQLRVGEDPMQSILSSDLIQEIAERMIPHNWSARAQPHPAAGPSLRLGLALTNLIGIDEHVPSRTGVPFLYTRYQDAQITDLKAPIGSSTETWTKIRASALASGAFPLAFRVRQIMRAYEEMFPGLKPAGATFSGNIWDRPFVYTDGGVFDNQPLGMARELAKKIDPVGDNDNRFYLFVSPWEKSTSIAKEPLQASSAHFLATLGALASAIFNQARFRDWVRAERMNADLNLLNQRALSLAERLKDDPALVGPLAAAAANLADAFVRAKGHTLAQERIRLQQVFAGLGGTPDCLQQLQAQGPALALAWTDTLLVFEYAANLEARNEMTIFGITAADSELASGGLHAFAGFFDERFRHHDYELGRLKAQAWLANHDRAPDVPRIGPIRYTPADTPQPDPKLNNLPLSDMPKGPRKILRDAITQRTDRLIEENIKVTFIGWAVRSVVKSKVKDWVGKQLGL